MHKAINEIERYHLLIPFPELITPMNATLVFAELILKENIENKTVPDESRIWVEKNSDTFKYWASKLGDIRTLNGNNSTPEEQSQKIIEALEGIEYVVNEGKSVSESLSNAGKEKNRVDYLIDSITGLYKHYMQAQNFLSEKEQN